MSKQEIFDLEKIKEIINPIEEIQGNLFEFEDNFNNFIKYKEEKFKKVENQVLIEQIPPITQILEEINENLTKISNENINKFLIFQDNLMKKYKDSFKNSLMKLKLSQDKTKKIGIFLIENKKICKVIGKSSIMSAIEVNQWLDILEALKMNSLFQLTIKKCENFYRLLIEKRLKNELDKIPGDTDQILINDFKNNYLKNPNITFKEFLQNIEKKLSEKELEARKIIIDQTKERQKIEELKKKQEVQRQAYEDYLRLSDKEFEKMSRKRRREKLSEIETNQTKTDKVQISEEVSEKIEKFKSKFENSFEEKYLVREDNEKDPLDLIRKRKEEKEKEYHHHIKKFRNLKE
ncbi:MAG: hypothetical protein EU532_08075 [Promethearchaeota archaeon]|nr:MAG: hypothetical protein EU532_08075 [Candidatus Lokiarchaeota archaeon]